jgi:pimeloyl-ACP methyl ester carboxylesterase
MHALSHCLQLCQAVRWDLTRAGAGLFPHDELPRPGAGDSVHKVRRRSLGLSLVAALCSTTLVLVGSASSAGAAAGQPNLPTGTFAQGLSADLTDPGGTPAGMNNWSCRPSEDHPYPVILLHGTLFNENLSWQALSPELADAGYCVYGFDYGSGPYSSHGVYAVSDIATSARELATFVNFVRIAAHARQVDVVGHSQGGMMPRYYMKFLGGASTIHMLIGLAPSTHGTTLDGSDALLSVLHSIGINVFDYVGCVA